MSLMQNLPGPGSSDRADDPATHDARELIPDGVQSKIVLDGKTYTLRITRTGKLILTK
jgi:hemin uptake protein HemP